MILVSALEKDIHTMNGNANTDTAAWKSGDKNFGTVAIHSGFVPKDYSHAPVVPPIVLSTTYEQDEPGKHRVRNKESVSWVLETFELVNVGCFYL